MVDRAACNLCAEQVLTHLDVPHGPFIAPVTVRLVVEQRVRICLLECRARFTSPYPSGDAPSQLVTPTLLARGALMLLDWQHAAQRAPRPDVLVSNDWVSALVAPYARKTTSWAGGAAAGIAKIGRDCLFVHLVHNLEPGYDGRLPLSGAHHGGAPPATMHQLPTALLHEPGRGAGGTGTECLNLSRAALLCVDSWATVSVPYREELLTSSNFAALLRTFGGAIACDSGLPLARRRRELAQYGTHADAKRQLQRECFGEAGVSEETPLLVYLGRVTYQKGVHLILDCVPSLIQSCEGRVQLLVCGQADGSDGYAQRCITQMSELRSTYPQHFWAAPHRYFCQGALASLAADFGVMPSVFEPSGASQPCEPTTPARTPTRLRPRLCALACALDSARA